MSGDPRKIAAKTRGRPFAKGNPGKPRGAHHRITLLAEALMEAEVQGVVQAAIDAAKAGDVAAAKVILDRICPARRDSAVNFDMPAIKTAAESAKAMGAVLGAVAAGDVTPVEAESITRIIDCYVKTLETQEFEARFRAIEKSNLP
jgi:hypothetical protein